MPVKTGMRPQPVVKSQISSDANSSISHAGIGVEIDLLVFDRPPERSTKTLSRHDPLPSMLIATPASTSTEVKAVDVNCERTRTLKAA